ncbi:MAG: low affinity iron permease family protein [Hyphomicrobiales bacterium]
MNHKADAHNHRSGANGSWLHKHFTRFAHKTAQVTGHPSAFIVAVLVVVVWAITGPIFNYSDTWQLVINTGTTIVTFLMVFLIQNTQNRDTMALQLKLTELVLAADGARNRFASIEDLSDEELEELHQDCRQRAEHTLHALHQRRAKKPKTSVSETQASGA